MILTAGVMLSAKNTDPAALREGSAVQILPILDPTHLNTFADATLKVFDEQRGLFDSHAPADRGPSGQAASEATPAPGGMAATHRRTAPMLKGLREIASQVPTLTWDEETLTLLGQRWATRLI